MCTCAHSVCACVRVIVFGLSVWVSSNMTSVTDTRTDRNTLIDFAMRVINTRLLSDAHARTRAFHSWRIGRFLRALEENVWTNTHTRARAHTHTHTTEHFQATMLTLFSDPERFARLLCPAASPAAMASRKQSCEVPGLVITAQGLHSRKPKRKNILKKYNRTAALLLEVKSSFKNL